MPLIMLPFFSSASAAAEKTRASVRRFADQQPVTPIIETMRAPSADGAITAVAWYVEGGLLGYLRALAALRKRA